MKSNLSGCSDEQTRTLSCFSFQFACSLSGRAQPDLGGDVLAATVQGDDDSPPAGRVAARRVELVPFPMDWANASNSVVDLSRFLDAPAGKDGFITTRGPHLVRPNGTRFRIWGVNLCGPDCFPDREEAPLLAADLARFGVNCVRFHFMDVDWGRHLFDARRDDTRRLTCRISTGSTFSSPN